MVKLIGTSREKILPFTLEDGVFAYAHFDVKIAGRTAVASSLALAVHADAIAGVDAREHVTGSVFSWRTRP